MSDDRLKRVRVSGSWKALVAFQTEHPPRCERIERDGKHYSIDAFVLARDVEAQRQRGLMVDELFDARKNMSELIKQVGVEDRFAAGEAPIPRGVPEGKRP